MSKRFKSQALEHHNPGEVIHDELREARMTIRDHMG